MFLVRNPSATTFHLKDDFLDLVFAPLSAALDLEVFFDPDDLRSSAQPGSALYLALSNGDLLRRNNTNTADIPFGPGTGPNTALYDPFWLYSPDEGQKEALVGTVPIPSATNRYVTELDYGVPSTVTTTDATPTLLYTLAVPNNSVMLIHTKVVAARTGGLSGTTGDGATFLRVGAVRNIGGVLSVDVVESAFTFRSQTSWSVIIEVSGLNCNIMVKGSTSNTVVWYGKTAGQLQVF